MEKGDNDLELIIETLTQRVKELEEINKKDVEGYEKLVNFTKKFLIRVSQS